MTTSTRPLREDERRSIEGLATTGSLISVGLIPTLFVFMLTFAAGIWIARALGVHSGSDVTWPAIAAAAAAIGFARYLYRKTLPLLSAEREAHTRDLAADTAVCAAFEVIDALRVEELEDEGSAYYLKLADGRVLFLQGQYLYEYEDGIEDEDGNPVQARFPADRFTVERTAGSGLVLGITGLGRVIPVSGVLPPFTVDEHSAGTVPQDGDILAIDFETLRRR
ncbi:MAG: hypothetical protein ACKVRO_10675 [Micropepsaceae bacterium]